MKADRKGSGHPSEPRALFWRPHHGFALIVTLSLMILLTVIAVGLLSLSSISLRASSQGEAMQAARANAKVALMLAIGDLQKQLGPDQRISTTADQISPTEAGVPTAPKTQRHWAGAYESWSTASANRPTPKFLQWFVSGAPDQLGSVDFAGLAISENAVEIVTERSVGVGGDTVRVTKLSQTTATGAKNNFAWWVGDEGVKAFVPSNPSPAKNGSSDDRLALQAMPHFGLEVMGAESEKPFANLDQESKGQEKLVSQQQTALAASSPDSIKPLFHDITTQNCGLLTNVRAGGFRQDLSMILQAPEASIPKAALYKAGGRDGINMAELWAYYNLCNELSPLKGGYTSGDSIPSAAYGLQQKASLSDYNSDKFYYQKQPAFVRFQQLLSFVTKPKSPATNPATYELSIVVDPIITLWNPLDVPISIDGSFNSIKYYALPYDLSVSFNGSVNTIPLSELVSYSGTDAYNFATMRIGKGSQGLVLKPGEVMTFSQPDALKSTTASQQRLDAKPGWVYNTTGGLSFLFCRVTKSGNNVFREPALVSGSGDSVIGYSVTPQQNNASYASAHNIYYKYDLPTDGDSKSVGFYSINKNIQVSNSKYAEFFDAVKPSADIPLNELTSKRPFMIFSFRAKTEEDAENPGRYFARYNPRAIKLDFQDLEQDEQRALPFEIKTQAVTSIVGMDQVVGQTQSNGDSYFGGGWTAETGATTVITHSVPRQPPVSLGALQHSLANGFPPDASGRINTNTLDYLLPQIDHAIGNSIASSLLASSQTEGSIGGPRPIADHSYLANQALWDDYFLSGISPQTTAVFSAKRDQKTVAKEFLDRTKPLPVKHYKPNLQGRDPETMLGALVRGTSPVADAEKLTASLISVEGMFNVNSTSVQAWKAILSSLRNRDIVGQNALGSDSMIKPEGGSANTSLLTPTNAKVKTESGSLVNDTQEAQWAGVHMLADAEIDSLAKALVLEVRKRGPFLSLADFINRRVGPDKKLALSGAIQSALDSDSVTINQPFRAGDRAATGSRAGLAFPEAENGAAAYGIPGYVKQADILTPIAPLLSARSDTFVIRGYGEKTDVTGKIVIAKAWCEAVVRRSTCYVDPTDEIITSPSDLKSPTNKTFGRHFDVVSFRWLNANEA